MAKKYCPGKNGKVYIDCNLKVIQPVEHCRQKGHVQVGQAEGTDKPLELAKVAAEGCLRHVVWINTNRLPEASLEVELREEFGAFDVAEEGLRLRIR
eukprot:3873995-Rhodomonas_salina.2